ncbi:unnamed protein product [Musa acuminata subsp. malaccensis]|uniref:(wild Malaysian banana) hypothetical protein n=1 Tax=Musa acuminata subsp. malaccensis TaxID=214687 RepID=A0A804I1Q3_MUSAM|nr:unnamed protein product [Musa acuminata subsp. malaccensis]
MVTLLPSLSSASASPNPNRPDRLLSLRPNTLALPSLSAAASRIRISSSSATSVPGRDPRVSDEWGEKPEPEADRPGEKAEPEVEASAQADAPKDEDEWGREPGGAEYLSGNGTPVPSDDKLEDLKRCQVDSLYGTELGLRASVEDRAEILELINQLEASNPTPAPTEAPELLDGNWILLYTSFSMILPLLAVGFKVHPEYRSSSRKAFFSLQRYPPPWICQKKLTSSGRRLLETCTADMEPRTRGCCKHRSFHLWPATSQSTTAWK